MLNLVKLSYKIGVITLEGEPGAEEAGETPRPSSWGYRCLLGLAGVDVITMAFNAVTSVCKPSTYKRN